VKVWVAFASSIGGDLFSKTRVYALIAALALIAGLAVTGCGGGDSSSSTNQGENATTVGSTSGGETLTVGSDIPFPPFEEGRPGHYTGFEIELIEAIAEKMGRVAQIQDTSFETIFRDVGQGKFDAVIAAATITPEREKEVDFSDPYYLSEQAVVVQEGSEIKGMEGLSGKLVGAAQGSTGLALAKKESGASEIRPFPESPDAINALKAGTVEAVVIDSPFAQNAVEEAGGIEIAEKIQTGEQYGIAVAQGNTELLEGINKGLKEVEEDGTYTQIFEKWFHEAPPKEVFGATHKAD
jgi:polar amino acid transport system substrate-binding protein